MLLQAQWLPDSQRLRLRDARRNQSRFLNYFMHWEALVTSTEYFNFSPEPILGCFKRLKPRLPSCSAISQQTQSPLSLRWGVINFLSRKTWVSVGFVINPSFEKDKLLPTLRHRPWS